MTSKTLNDFDMEEFVESVRANPELKQNYYSELYQQRFPLKGNLAVRLNPIDKKDVGRLVPEFKKKLKNPRSSYEKSTSQFEPNEYCLFRYSEEVDLNPKRKLHIRFRTKGESKLVDEFLDALQESNIIRYCCDSTDLDTKVPQDLMKVYNQTIKESQVWVTDPYGMLGYIKDGRRRDWIRDKLKDIFNALSFMSSKGYNINKVVNEIRDLQIPPYSHKEDPIWNSALTNLTS